MSDRHQILRDEEFWLKLEYVLCGWFRTCGDRSLGGFWCDGVISEFAGDTKEGIEVTGIAWIVDGRNQHKCSFTASIPQRMLARRRDEFVVTELALDLKHKNCTFAVAPSAVTCVGGLPG